MLPYYHAGRSLIEFTVTLLIGLAPVVCGLLVLSFQVDRKQEETIAVTSREAVYSIDRVIQSLHETTSRALWLAGRPCEDVLPELRHEVIKQPNVRSLALEQKESIFCSTLYGVTDIAFGQGDYVNGRLRVDPGSPATPGSAILLYRLQSAPHGAVAVANLKVLHDELLGFQNAVVLTLQFGERYVWATGHGDWTQLPNQKENTVKIDSDRFGYTVHAGYPAGESWSAIRQAMHQTLPSLLLVGIMTSAAAYWGLFRRGRNRAAPDRH
ncbi:CSS-motif domain-containing protein [Pseudomonas alkylphenolica]|uniref:CSS-motif domain-containing protein n=1 Tax=Pseudomonas alkylphenolica TaxID=237609 RepID=UPI0018D93B38|nr:CSS-motif domain-containing protein [Pseudomonas alkylphenolica]MBH3429768.1 CSS-motif domain-containing protein [Pseudomonas alkylphenolica]